jgi:hypothetical protein
LTATEHVVIARQPKGRRTLGVDASQTRIFGNRTIVVILPSSLRDFLNRVVGREVADQGCKAAVGKMSASVRLLGEKMKQQAERESTQLRG